MQRTAESVHSEWPTCWAGSTRLPGACKPKIKNGMIEDKAKEEMQGNHDHVEVRLLRRPQVPRQRSHAGEVKPIGREQGKADEDDPEQGAQPRPDGGLVNPPGTVAHGRTGVDIGKLRRVSRKTLPRHATNESTRQ